MRSRTVSDVFAILFAREEKWGTLARMDAVCVKSEDTGYCHEMGHPRPKQGRET